MASRGGPGRRMPGGGMEGVLRDVARTQRTVTRTPGRSAPAPEAVPPVPGPPGPPGPAGGAQGVRMACDGNGTATWVFPRPFTRPPAVAAVAEASVPLVVVLTEVSAVRAVAVAWMWAAGAWHRQAGAVVHLTATASAVD